MNTDAHEFRLISRPLRPSVAMLCAELVAAGRADTFLEGTTLGVVSIDSGAAKAKVEALAKF